MHDRDIFGNLSSTIAHFNWQITEGWLPVVSIQRRRIYRRSSIRCSSAFFLPSHARVCWACRGAKDIAEHKHLMENHADVPNDLDVRNIVCKTLISGNVASNNKVGTYSVAISATTAPADKKNCEGHHVLRLIRPERFISGCPQHLAQFFHSVMMLRASPVVDYPFYT